MRLQRRVAIVTGGSSGIGRGIALELAREGAAVAVADIRETPKIGRYYETEPRQPTVDEIRRNGGRGIFLQGDIACEVFVQRLVDRTVEEFGALDILVNNAGVHIPGTSQTLSVADWDRVLSINLRALFLTTKVAVPHLKRSSHGRIIHISSVNYRGGGAGPVYAPTKAAVVNLARDTAVELGPLGITVNAVCPGFIETANQDYLTPEQIEDGRQRTLLPRFGTPRDIARACVFLASGDASWITGSALVVDGGWMATV